ncbi:hypothetical protein [Aquaspirillum sp. LM1]|uniref:hypothetical protein n=1 Tax=Aquaspirillum sp. LM1 TaxID=1938604 RepID=UPI0012379E5E|nr:hypothetical protein [Aquaspirillum sp. LM1]
MPAYDYGIFTDWEIFYPGPKWLHRPSFRQVNPLDVKTPITQVAPAHGSTGVAMCGEAWSVIEYE